MLGKILYADDEANYRRLIKMFLERADYEVITVSDGKEAIDILNNKNDIDLVILDVMMPKFNGWQACHVIREKSNIPIIMLTALGDATNEVYGIEKGADDYIAKPFSQEVLIARVGGLLRRVRKNKQEQFNDEGMAFEESTNSVYIDNNKITLRPKEYELLMCLVLNKSIVLSREQILDNVWGYDYFGDPRTVDTHIKSLRSKLGDEGKRIKTLRNKGYCYRGVE
ncbi:response regulator transcription factor [Oceanirhabdus sp. W0125-5]|uniref:response regulator transcription factor n=1 Tax=Oceanirhabdus sp. W0125-5 TaxID=2999116 RepID=UPI002FDD55C7